MSRHIGIFGDSFATKFTSFRQGSGKVREINFAWPKLLEVEYGYNVKYCAAHGTSLYWSFLQFLEHKNNCDIILFAITDSHRLYIKDHVIAGLPAVEHFLQTDSDKKQDYSVWQAAKHYYTYLIDTNFCLYIYEKIIEDIIKICEKENKKLILLPTTRESLKFSNIFSHSLVDITQKELVTQFGNMTIRPETDKRICHLSIENNQRLAKLLDGVIKGTIDKIKLHQDFKFEKVSDPENYWELE